MTDLTAALKRLKANRRPTFLAHPLPDEQARASQYLADLEAVYLALTDQTEVTGEWLNEQATPQNDFWYINQRLFVYRTVSGFRVVIGENPKKIPYTESLLIRTRGQLVALMYGLNGGEK